MNILVLNSGSSSLKFQLINLKTEQPLIKGMVDGIGLNTCKLIYTIGKKETVKKAKVKNPAAAVKLALDSIKAAVPSKSIACVGHRVVHGGESYRATVKIDARVLKTIDELSVFAPLHNPANLAGIKVCLKLLPKLPQIAVFDTAFHQTIPKKAFLYGIPYKYYKKYKIRKYGFHGTSHKYVMLKAKELLGKKKVNLITCHLGNGSSITAIQKNKSIDTTMGFTPLQGLMMGTRSGDIDPSIVAFIANKEKITADKAIQILNKESGLFGIDGYSDVRTIHKKAIAGDKKCKLGLQMFAYRVCEYIGAYEGVLDGVDAIVFTAGIGENAYYLRTLICEHLWNIGIKLDAKKNRRNDIFINSRQSKVKVLVIPTNEGLMIARDAKKVLRL